MSKICRRCAKCVFDHQSLEDGTHFAQRLQILLIGYSRSKILIEMVSSMYYDRAFCGLSSSNNCAVHFLRACATISISIFDRVIGRVIEIKVLFEVDVFDHQSLEDGTHFAQRLQILLIGYDRLDSYFPPAISAEMSRTMSFEPESRIQPHRPMQKLHTAKLLAFGIIPGNITFDDGLTPVDES
jgi:hypothetical protein